jgi:hypothetical protein
MKALIPDLESGEWPMKMLVLSLTVLGLAGFTGVAQAGMGCSGASHEQTAETPPPPPPPAPTT